MPLARRVPCSPVIHGARQLLGQEGQGFALAVCVLQFREVLLARGMVPQQQDGRFRAGPLELGVADLCARGAVPLPSRLLRALDEAAIREAILDPREPADVVDCLEEPETQDLADAGHGLPPVEGIRVVLLGQAHAGQLHVVQPRVVVVNQCEVPRHAFLHVDWRPMPRPNK